MKYSEQITIAHKTQKPFVAYKNPQERIVNVIVQNSDELIEFNDFSMSGYIFAPFNSDEKAYLIKPDVCFEDPIQSVDVVSEKNSLEGLTNEKELHISLVEKTIQHIKTTQISKVVVSRNEKVSLSSFDLLVTFNKMLNKYINAYVYVWYHPQVGLWMGATPETLLNVKNNKFKTMALAGTQRFLGDLKPLWGEKELEEQQMVSSFIEEHLKDLVDDLKLSKVETVKAGSLLHLKTSIIGSLSRNEDLARLIDLLHPTPAVCGLPKQESKEFILQNENYHRSFYSGYLGELNMFNRTSLFVNLRCFQFKNNIAYLYVGGGITASSNAANEWEETVEKSKIIKSIL